MKNITKLVESDFNRKESFTCENIPKHFDSITETSIRNIKQHCSRVILKKYNNVHNARTLKAMINTIDGEFDQLYARLEGDYSARLANLEECREKELRKVRSELTNFEKIVSDHENAFNIFASNVEAFNNDKPSENLRYSHKKIEDFEARLMKLMEKNHEK